MTKPKTLFAIAACCLLAAAAFAADTGIAGKWATDTAAAAINQAAQNSSLSFGGGVGQQGGQGGARRAPQSVQQIAAAQQQSDKNAGPAVTMELKINAKKSTVKGSITELVTNSSYEIQDGTFQDSKFAFKTMRSAGGKTSTLSWTGELTDEKTLKMSRIANPGEAPVTEPPMVFHRSK